ncbi:MAG: hypothetical protein COZ06_09930 [Armatimonadetes bacterium CG_4_10_14_3_um_filter_66_18]|nr:MAG: hypothetical protein COS65_25995 [Armatimonadetes bacterium CG06_land_8_20_14_3_00_66_21]PIX46037.1 MAG: hypothetical protein COZ57_13670 [Armatimonadetes bacterium CG_4_8_14_3_um_filter_66_20]PIY50326.1 MAG: hypothetical protein COZ06_09930 [Armatimonadetes bacterium CG_4_10_14_3_um_filter_66_18]PIZ43131.1 MAG: hypothetical protein COY42_16345 [Armatimonadetes bacterium CG_4_10_14_0_8_um_filter_66_14]PJB75483.1 MAG: hypothetical protein CO096_01955 [Armatimonadetes bacterium CG_4_9_14_
MNTEETVPQHVVAGFAVQHLVAQGDAAELELERVADPVLLRQAVRANELVGQGRADAKDESGCGDERAR